jgi:hypothetical protein
LTWIIMIEYSKYRYFITNPHIWDKEHFFSVKTIRRKRNKITRIRRFYGFKSRLTSASLNP